MKNLLIPFFVVIIILTACDTTPDPFLVTKHSVGKLNDSTQVKDLKRVFETDSLSQFIGGDEFTCRINFHSPCIKHRYDAPFFKLSFVCKTL